MQAKNINHVECKFVVAMPVAAGMPYRRFQAINNLFIAHSNVKLLWAINFTSKIFSSKSDNNVINNCNNNINRNLHRNKR